MSSFNQPFHPFLRHLMGCCLLYFGLAISATADDTFSLAGTWVSDNPLLTRVEILPHDDGLQIVAFRACETGECDWGTGEIRFHKTSYSPQTPRLSAYFLSAIGEAQIDLEQIDAGVLKATLSATILGDEGMEEIALEAILQPEGANDSQWQSSTETGTITASLYGPAASVASIFQAAVYGPDEPTRLRGMHNLMDGMQVENLETGTYWIRVEPKGQTAIKLVKDEFRVQIMPGKTQKLEIELY